MQHELIFSNQTDLSHISQLFSVFQDLYLTIIITESTHEIEIIKRRNQASRSLLIQVHSLKSYNDLHNYCLRFGDISSMHHYHINNQQVCQLLFNIYPKLNATLIH